MLWLKKLLRLHKEKEEFDTPIFEKLKDEQQMYVDVLVKLISSLKFREIEVFPEAQVQLESTQLPEFFRQSRVDVLYKEDFMFHQAEAKVTNPPEFSPLFETWRNIEIVLFPFVWHSMEFNITGPEPSIDQLQNWFTRWFDPKSRNRPDTHGMHGVIHTMTPPLIFDGSWQVTIDFGTAEMDAFQAFFRQCRFSGAKKIEISSANYLRNLMKEKLPDLNLTTE
jgi:hypothetical protein